MEQRTDSGDDRLTLSLTYVGFILLAHELMKGLIVGPIKTFYANTTFAPTSPFKSYEHDVLSRHKSEFEACLLYLRDFMEAIDADDMLAIQGLRRHRNELAHDLAEKLASFKIDEYSTLIEKASKALFKLSNYRTYIEIGADPEFRDKGIDWNTIVGGEYMLFDELLKKVRNLQSASSQTNSGSDTP